MFGKRNRPSVEDIIRRQRSSRIEHGNDRDGDPSQVISFDAIALGDIKAAQYVRVKLAVGPRGIATVEVVSE